MRQVVMHSGRNGKSLQSNSSGSISASVGSSVGVRVGAGVGSTTIDGRSVGITDTGASVGFKLAVGPHVSSGRSGTAVGARLGHIDGALLGTAVGSALGVRLGDPVGTPVGASVGSIDGWFVSHSSTVEGCRLG